MTEVAFLGGSGTDEGLLYLEGLSTLKSLFLTGPKITDAGLQHLKGLSATPIAGHEGT